MANCPKCGNGNPNEAVFCGHCGFRLISGDDAKKTMFGYQADPNLAAPPAPQAPAPAPAPAAAHPPAAAAAPQAAGLTPGATFASRYTVERPLGRLPVGEVAVARDSQTSAEVELWLVDATVFPSPLDMERARREMRQLQKVEHPALAGIIDHGKLDDGRLYVVLGPAAQHTLADVVARGAMSIEQAQQIVRDVGGALAEAQKVGVIHRDIAPHNIVFAADGRVRLRGFGVAAPIKRHVFGTAEFISPEQAAGRPVDQRSNIYSLGALMFYMLSGQPPFAGTPDQLIEAHQKTEAPQLAARVAGIDARADQLVAKALAKSSSRRHLTLRQFLREVDALGASVGGVPAPAPRQPVSFETPLHGVTALTGGDRPPSSEIQAVEPNRQQVVMPAGAASVDDNAKTMMNVRADDVTAAAAAFQAQQQQGAAPGQSAAPMAASAPAVPPPQAVSPAQAPTDPQGVPQTMLQSQAQPQAPQTSPPQGGGGLEAIKTVTPESGAVVGEMAGGQRVSIRQSEEVAAVKPAEGAGDAAQQGGSGGRFRETMWFFKGEVESAMAESGESEESAAIAEKDAKDAEVLKDKYVDDGSMSEEEARRLSLRTGKTQMMQAVGHVPDGHVPGEQMKEGEFIHEMNPGRKYALIIGLIVLLAGIGVALYFIL